MSPIDDRMVRVLPQGIVAVILIFMICMCVVSQMLGAPVTLLDVLTSDAPVESFSEDFSIPPMTPEPSTPIRFSFHAESHPSVHHQIFSTSVFHPPQG